MALRAGPWQSIRAAGLVPAYSRARRMIVSASTLLISAAHWGVFPEDQPEDDWMPVILQAMAETPSLKTYIEIEAPGHGLPSVSFTTRVMRQVFV